MAKRARLRPVREASWLAHPPWCNLSYVDSNDHDPHYSHRVRVDIDGPSDLIIEAYLQHCRRQLDHRYPTSVQAILEFTFPGEDDASYLLTFGQLCDLTNALHSLVESGRMLWHDHTPPDPHLRPALDEVATVLQLLATQLNHTVTLADTAREKADAAITRATTGKAATHIPGLSGIKQAIDHLARQAAALRTLAQHARAHATQLAP
jgi:hypothetical protein